jgi:beta-glucosidase
LVVEYRVDQRPTGPVTLSLNGAAVPITQTLRSAAPGSWGSLTIPLGCFAQGGRDMTKVTSPFTVTTSGRLTMAVSGIQIASAPGPQDRCSL